MPEKTTYASSGVDINEENKAVSKIVDILKATSKFREGKLGEVKSEIGHYANFVDIGANQYLVLSTDSAGTKVLVAQEANKFDTIAIDMIAMNVNDIICVGAEPITMVDYLAVETTDEKIAGEIAIGLAEGAKQAGIAIIGGETATLKGVITGINGKGFDIAGTCLGVVQKDKVVLGDKIAPGDKIIGLASTGIHSNGYTLARKVMLENHKINDVLPWGKKVSEELLTPTMIYVKPVLKVLEKHFSEVTGLSNITGSGFLNLKRLNKDVGFHFDSILQVPKIFGEIQRLANIDDAEMFRTFNMGMGFAIIVRNADEILATLKKEGIDAKVVGEVTDRAGVVEVSEKGIEL